MEISKLPQIQDRYLSIVDQMCIAAAAAGAEILNVYAQNDFGIEFKEDESPLTLADSRADTVINKILTAAFPDIPIISEENHGNLYAGMARMFFLIDPLDGTKEFIKKTGEFTVNIAFILDGKSELGVVLVPSLGELYYRDIDGSSYLLSGHIGGDIRNRSEKITCRIADAENLTVVQSVSHSTPETDAYVAKYLPKSSISAGSSLKFCMLARGAADLYPRLGRTMEWDTAAAHAVLKGAGGNVFYLDTLKELQYGKFGMENPFFVASTPELNLLPRSTKM